MPEAIKNFLPAIRENFPLFPEQASTVAGEIDLLTFAWLALSVFFSLLIAGGIVFLSVKYHRRSPTHVGVPTHRTAAIEIATMLVPFVIAMAMFAWGAKVYFQLRRPPADAIEYFAFGKQWMWKYQHPNGKRQINHLTIPVHTPIKLTMTSEDVIHSFFVPEFRVKQDVLPGRYTTVWFEAKKTGVFRQFCAEYCGSEHARMGGSVRVVDQVEYEAFLAGHDLGAGPTSTGERLFTDLACVTCHQDATQGRGPSLHGLFGSEVELASGERLLADEEYLRESILRPMARIKAGYTPLMPTFEGQVSEEQLRSLISYIKSLGASDGHGEGEPQTATAGVSGSRIGG